MSLYCIFWELDRLVTCLEAVSAVSKRVFGWQIPGVEPLEVIEDPASEEQVPGGILTRALNKRASFVRASPTLHQRTKSQALNSPSPAPEIHRSTPEEGMSKVSTLSARSSQC